MLRCIGHIGLIDNAFLCALRLIRLLSEMTYFSCPVMKSILAICLAYTVSFNLLLIDCIIK